MTYTIDTVQDLVSILDEHPQWLEALRARLLTRALLEMPERLAQLGERVDQLTERVDQLTGHVDQLTERMDQLTERMDQLTERMDQLTERMDQLTERMDQLAKRMDQLTERMDELAKRMDQLTERMDELAKRMDQLTERMDEFAERMDQLTERMDQLAKRMDQLAERMDQFASETRQEFATTNRRLDRVIDDLGTIKGVHAQNVTHKEAALLVARLGLQLTRSLSAADLLRITGSADTSDIPANVLSSFHRADLVVEAAGPEGDPCYVAVEASYTINGRDTERALRNARFLTEFTGRRCYAAVSGYRLDDRVRQHVDSGEVFWYQLDTESLQAD